MTPPINSVSDERLAELLQGSTALALTVPDFISILTELAARRAANTPASPEAEPQGSCASCNGTGDLGGNPSYGMCPDCDGTGKFPPASPALPSQVLGVTVKPLEWVAGNRCQYKSFDGIIHTARTELGRYEVWHYMERKGQQFLWHSKSRWFDTLEEAKAAAQQDFNARIQSCITSPAAEPVAWRWTEKDGDTGGVTDREDIAEYAKVKGCDVTALYTHPAPSASREVTE
jgi:hypothetical protein